MVLATASPKSLWVWHIRSMSQVAATTGRVLNNKNLKHYFPFEDDRQMDADFRGDALPDWLLDQKTL